MHESGTYEAASQDAEADYDLEWRAAVLHFEPERIRLEAELNKLVKNLLEASLGCDDKAALPSPSAVRRA